MCLVPLSFDMTRFFTFLDATCGFLVWRMAGSFGSLDTDVTSVSDCMWTIRETKTTEAIQVYIAKLYQETSDCASFNLEASMKFLSGRRGGQNEYDVSTIRKQLKC